MREHGGRGGKVPGSWESSGDEEDEWDDEDDFGIPLSAIPSRSSTTSSEAQSRNDTQSEVD